MPEFVVKFRGDLGNLAQFNAAIKNSTVRAAQDLERAQQRLLTAQVGITKPLTSDSGAGLFTRKTGVEIDRFNNTFRHTGEIVKKTLTDYRIAVDEAGRHHIEPVFTQDYYASFDKAMGNFEKYQAAKARTAATDAKILADREATLKRILPLEQQIEYRRAGIQRIRGIIEEQRQAPDAAVDTARLKLQQAQATGAAPTVITQLKNELVQAEQAAAQAIQPFINSIKILQAEIRGLETAIRNMNRGQVNRAAKIRAGNPAYAAADAALLETPPIERNLQSVLNNFQRVRGELLRAGLGNGAQYGTEQFKKALADQEASITRFAHNARTGVTTIQGQFLKTLKDGSQIVSDFTYDIDKQGKVIQRWGGQLSGAGSILRQTVRDFQKVIEWTVATTIVFGSLAAVIGQLSSINELNTALARLSITSQTNAEESQKLFNALGQVAIATATPLKEIITVADDIALATREAGQSTEEWRQKIVDLTTAVGIFTNLTGVETVQATDQLSAAFKQLGIAPEQLVTVLNKVTAVAGGQSQAIADIVKALSSVSEAAKAAGFSLDEQIAAVQVLSQVTNKSADEIATSFKNLFGSVSSVGSEKILKEFGIAVRDSEGGIRDFLDIYRDVQKAIEQGIIPQNRIPDILRGIAGGPRRAPDAAALLANIGRIDATVGTAVGATNEALIANAKILDTNQAKITQFQNAIDIAVFQQFGKAVEDLTANLTDIGTFFANTFSGIDPFIVSTLIKVGLLAGAFKVFGGLLKNFIVPGIKDLAASLAIANTQATTTQSTLLRIGGVGIGSRAGKLGAIGAIAGGAAVGVAAGLDTNNLGLILQTVGGITALVPGLQAVGLATLGIGTAIQILAGDSNEAKKSTQDLSEEIYGLTQNLKAQQSEANGYAESQKQALSSIKQLQGIEKKTAEDRTALSVATEQYVTASLNLAKANKQVADTFEQLKNAIPGLSDSYNDLIGLVQRGLIDPNSPEIQDLVVRLSRDILQATGQSIASTTTPGNIDTRYRAGSNTRLGSVINRDRPFDIPEAPFIGTQNRFDFGDLKNNPLLLKGLLGGDTQSLIKTGLADQSNMQTALIALAQLPELVKQGSLTQEEFQRIVDALQEIAANSSSFANNSLVLSQQQAAIQAKGALGIFTQNQAGNALSANQVAQALNTGSKSGIPGQSGYLEEKSLERIQKLIAAFKQLADQGLKPTNDQLKEAGTLMLLLTSNGAGGNVLSDLLKLGPDAVNKGIADALLDAGFSAEQLDEFIKQYNIDIEEAAGKTEELVAALDTAKKNAREAYADRSLSLLIAENSGQFEKNAKGLEILKQQNREAYETTLQLIDGIGTLSQDAFVELNNSLASAIGLTGIYISDTELNTLTTEQLAQKQSELGQTLIENAVKAGVNAEGIRKIRDVVFELIAAINALPPYKEILINVTTIGKTFGTLPGFLGDAADSLFKKVTESIGSSQKSQSDAIKKLIREYNKLLKGGKGSNLGAAAAKAAKKAGSSAAYNQPGLLDIPEEIINSGNASSLIAQAVKNARALQSKVPGEAKHNRNEIVELLNGTKRVLETRGIGEEYLRRALQELTDQVKRQNDLLSKADSIRRIRVQNGSFGAIANVPINSQSGVSVGGPNSAVNITLNLNGTVVTPAQFSQLADLIASALKRQLSN